MVGINDTQLFQLRRQARKAACRHTAGRNLTIDLALLGDQVDPAYRCNRDPILMWLQGLWDHRLPRAWMQTAFLRATHDMAKCKRPWQVVKGPAGAVVATLRRIGWRVISPVKWETHVGVVHVCKTCPKSIAKLVDQATEMWLWREVAGKNPTFDGFASGALMKPILRLLREPSTPDWSEKHKGQLRSIVAEGQWPQARLFRAGLVDDPSCVACGHPAGTMHHRFWDCPARESFRRAYGIDAIIRCARSRPLWPLFTRALAPSRLRKAPAPIMEDAPNDTPVWDIHPEFGCLTGDICGDGSGLGGTEAMLRRCGYSVCQVLHDNAGDDEGVITGSLSGALPGVIQEVPLAELYGLYMALRHALPQSPTTLTAGLCPTVFSPDGPARQRGIMLSPTSGPLSGTWSTISMPLT